MRIESIALAIGLTGLALVAPSQVKANPHPFKNCAELQSYANSLEWGKPTTVQGYENSKIINMPPNDWGRGGGQLCENGYLIEDSLMGKKVCFGDLAYRIKRGRGEIFPWPNMECRWQ